jgi:hypothetical protein
LAADAHRGGDEAMYTDIVKARAIRRAGRACEMCGTPLSFDSAHFVSAHPIFGILFDQDDCCVLCRECLDDLEVETRAAMEGELAAREPEGGSAIPFPGEHVPPADERPGASEQEQPAPQPGEAGGGATLPRSARKTWLPRSGPDDDICA